MRITNYGVFIGVLLAYFAFTPAGTLAQEGTGNDDPLATTSLGISLSGPLAPMAHHVGFAWGCKRWCWLQLRQTKRAHW